MRSSSTIGTWRVLLALAAAAAGGSIACGRYGTPLRAEVYRDAEDARAHAEAQERQKSPEERNEPLPKALP